MKRNQLARVFGAVRGFLLRHCEYVSPGNSGSAVFISLAPRVNRRRSGASPQLTIKPVFHKDGYISRVEPWDG